MARTDVPGSRTSMMETDAHILPSHAWSGSPANDDLLDARVAERAPRDNAMRISIITVTFGRDHIVPTCIAQVRDLIAGRNDVEYILVDNNPDEVDRSFMLIEIPQHSYVKLGANKGVAARNDGAQAATGRLLIFIDDDAVLHPLDALDLFEATFRNNPALAIASARHLDVNTGETPRAAFPHTDKSRRKDLPFKTFRFQGNGFAMRRDVFLKVGPMSDDYFYGLEEIDYAYRVIEAGYELAYEPSVWVIEHNDPGGRKPKRAVEEMRLTNKFIISWKHMPASALPFNFVFFSAYVFALNRGRLNVLRAFGDFVRWARRNPGRRAPIGQAAQSYIRTCGGQVWK